MAGTWRKMAVLAALVLFGALGFGMSVESKETTQPLALRAELNQSIELGSEIRPNVVLVNVSGKPLKVVFLRPSIAVPEIFDQYGKRVNAPSFVYDQICARTEKTLEPNEDLGLFSLPIMLRGQKLPAQSEPGLRGYWEATPGRYTLKYSVQVKDFVPGGSGVLHASDLHITVADGKKDVVGVLSFEHGKGYYITTKEKKEQIWLQIAEDKILVARLQSNQGREIKVRGKVDRTQTDRVVSAFPPNSLYVRDFQILSDAEK